MDGANGMCYEHTASEGVAVVSAVSDIFKSFESMNDNLEHPVQNVEKKLIYEKLNFKLDEKMKIYNPI